MIAEQKSSLIMFVLVCLAIIVYLLGMGVYTAVHLEPLPVFRLVFQGLFLCGVVWWLRADPQSSPVSRVYCTGLFVSLAWPIIIPYHLIKTRGATGLVHLFALFATLVIGAILAAVIYVAVSGFASD